MKRPNILFIVADDLGYADLGCYGGRNAAFGPVSPNLDALARQGALFTQGYANSPVCSPTRFALITGRYQYRIRGAAEEPLGSQRKGHAEMGLFPHLPTMPSLLQKAGYRTALIGKWHLGFPPHFGPTHSGYEHFFGMLSGGVDYFTHCDSRGQHDLWMGDAPAQAEGYLTDVLTEHALERIDTYAQSDAPFLLSLHYTAPHWPWETRDDAGRAPQVRDHLFDLTGGNVETYRRMIHHMDEGIGRLVERLRHHGMLEDTLIIFTSDNGGERFSDNWPLVGGKMDLTEGGIRVPWIAHWPRAITPGTVSAQHCLSMDWTATVLDAAQVAADPDYPLDGVSLLPVLQSPSRTFERPMYWRMKHRQQRAARLGDWKYLQVDDNEYLFNLAEDERERSDRKGLHPGRFEQMRAQWLEWNASMPAIPDDAMVILGYSERNMPSR